MNVIKFAISRSISKSQISNLYKYLKLIAVTMMISLVFSSCAFEKNPSYDETEVIEKIRKARYELLLGKVSQGKSYDVVFAGDGIPTMDYHNNKLRLYTYLLNGEFDATDGVNPNGFSTNGGIDFVFENLVNAIFYEYYYYQTSIEQAE